MKTVFITGTNRGIGASIANILHNRGWRVFRTARQIPENSDENWVQLDVSDPDSVTNMKDLMLQKCDICGIDVLINNAGVAYDMGGQVEDVDTNVIFNTLNVNLFGVMRVTNALLPLLKKNGNAHVINMSSGAGSLSNPIDIGPAYCISKTALNGLTVQQALAWSKYGIRVNSMSPGWVKTDMGGPDAPGTVEDGADTAVWLTMEAPADLTGKFFANRQEIPW